MVLGFQWDNPREDTHHLQQPSLPMKIQIIRRRFAAAPASSLGYIISEVAPQALSALVEAGQDNAAKAVYAELLAYAAYVAVGIKAYNQALTIAIYFKPCSDCG